MLVIETNHHINVYVGAEPNVTTSVRLDGHTSTTALLAHGYPLFLRAVETRHLAAPLEPTVTLARHHLPPLVVAAPAAQRVAGVGACGGAVAVASRCARHRQP